MIWESCSQRNAHLRLDSVDTLFGMLAEGAKRVVYHTPFAAEYYEETSVEDLETRWMALYSPAVISACLGPKRLFPVE